MTTIRYFIPEDGDDEMCPNVFLAPKPRQPGTPPTLGSVKDAFPLPGRYHFRFKCPLFPGADREKGAMAVWMDTVNDSAPVPTWKNTIVAKVTRIAAEEEDDDDDDDFVGGGRATAHAGAPPATASSRPAPAPISAPPPRAPPSHQNSMQSSSSADHLDIFDAAPPAPAPAPAPNTAVPPQSMSGNLLDGHGMAPQAPAPSAGSTLLDMDGYGHPEPTASSAHNDFLGMTAPPPATPSRPPPPQQQQQQQQQQQPVGYPGSTPGPHHHNPYGATPQTAQRGGMAAPPQGGVQQAQKNAFDSFSNQQGPFGGLGTPWKS